MAFDKVPSQLWPLFWNITYYDIQTKLRLFIGEHQLMVNQQFQVLQEAINQMFGGSSKSEGGGSVPATGAEALQMFKGLSL